MVGLDNKLFRTPLYYGYARNIHKTKHTLLFENLHQTLQGTGDQTLG